MACRRGALSPSVLAPIGEGLEPLAELRFLIDGTVDVEWRREEPTLESFDLEELRVTFDLDEGEIDVRGTVARLGPLQRIIARIPGLNRLILGRDRAGIIATSFRLTGPLRDPDVTVNPLSNLTPGFTRDLFGKRDKKPRAGEGEG